MNTRSKNGVAAPTADYWRLRDGVLRFGRLPLLMGIVNVTPDSFSDGGRFFDPEAAVEHGLQLVADGADIIDVGGESTRPFSEPVDVQEELRRVMPVVGALCTQTKIPISVDTTKALVAKHAIHAGAQIINDITALTGDPAMLPLAVESKCGVCAMHMRGIPRTMQESPSYDDVVGEVFDYLQRCRDSLMAAGIEQDRIALDPGIGFGKSTGHNLQLLSHAAGFHRLGCPVLIGHSRKRFLAWVNEDADVVEQYATPAGCDTADTINREMPQKARDGEPRRADLSADLQANQVVTLPLRPLAADRNVGTIAVALAMARQNVQILRVHDVAAVRQALLAFAASGGLA
jgi:dihydropteroate synthase